LKEGQSAAEAQLRALGNAKGLRGERDRRTKAAGKQKRREETRSREKCRAQSKAMEGADIRGME
jgi:hypothetical protein